MNRLRQSIQQTQLCPSSSTLLSRCNSHSLIFNRKRKFEKDDWVVSRDFFGRRIDPKNNTENAENQGDFLVNWPSNLIFHRRDSRFEKNDCVQVQRRIFECSQETAYYA